ncbi:hypothetical protein [Roseimaritima ulvae]|uniref:Uncharacterized protein n=1 Tax=Roseimaritima ulvae TaxID=980254 RepID=A0A5B9QNP6_9BACT|nr:hypothetical protein [Roseimaritima ulvae]QEG40727.1 hypothetical protein UC8_27440 [Roseimaritima ulvae]
MIRRRWVVRGEQHKQHKQHKQHEKHQQEPAMSHDGDSSSEEELAQLRQRVAELEAELAARSAVPPSSGNLIPLALILLAVEAVMILVCLPLAHWCSKGQLSSSGWAELAYVAGLLMSLAVPLSLCAVNVLLFSLWSIATGPRLLIAGALTVASILAVVWQWWLIDMGELVVFVAGATCMLFVPAMGLRLLTRWRVQWTGEPWEEQHAAPRTFDLLLLTVVFAIGISIIRWYFGSAKLELNSGYLWWLAGINSLLPATVVCLGAYCSLRAVLGPRRIVWFPAAVLVNGAASGVFMLQIVSQAFQTWPPEFWPQMVNIGVDMAVLMMAIGIPLLLAPLLPIGFVKLANIVMRARLGGRGEKSTASH